MSMYQFEDLLKEKKTEKFWQLLANVHTSWPILYTCRPTIAKVFQSNGNKSKSPQDVDLNFSEFVHHMSGLN